MDIQFARRFNKAGSVVLEPQPFHRLTMHMSALTVTACRESRVRFARLRGDIDVTPANSPGGFDSTEDCDSLDVCVPGRPLERLAVELGVPAARASLATEHLVRDRALQGLVLALAEGGDDASSLYRDSVSTALALRLLSRPHDARVKPVALARGEIGPVIEYIEEHLGEHLTLELLAGVACVSRSSLHRSFKRLKGMGLHRYVMLRRVERARSLIARGVPHSEVAVLTGFSDQSHMARWVRRVHGIAPRALALWPSVG